MFRLPRGVLVIWLLLAVLPLRGLAHELMAVTHGTPVTTATLAEAPCHGHGGDAAPGADAGTAHGSAACQFCGLCHGAWAPAGVGVVVATAPQARALPTWAAPAQGRPDVDPFFRPPRR